MRQAKTWAAAISIVAAAAAAIAPRQKGNRCPFKEKIWERTKQAASRGLASLLVAGAGVLGLADNSAASPVIGIGDVVQKSEYYKSYTTTNLRYQGATPNYKIMVFPFKFGDIGTQYEYQPLLVGGLQNNPSNPNQPKTTAPGYINKEDATFYGLNVGDVIGTAVPGRIVGGKIPAVNGNVAGGFLAFVDYNGDGKVGTKDTSTGVITPDPGELLMPYKVVYSGFSPFPASGKGTITSINIRPEMSYIANIFPQINPKDPADTRVKIGWLEFDFYGDKIFTQTSTNPPGWKLCANYRVTFWEDVNEDGIGDGNWDGTNDDRQLLDAVTGQPVFQDNHVTYLMQDISPYALDDGSEEYKMHAFEFGYPEFVLPNDKELHSVYAKVENLQDANLEFIQFEPYYSGLMEIPTCPDPATIALLLSGAVGVLARRRARQ
jgi:hypothetical protein